MAVTLINGSQLQFTQDLDVNDQKITSLSTPTSDSDAATKKYVDDKYLSIDAKESVRVATTANGTMASAFANGVSVDGVTLATNDRILIKNQTDGSENGIYTVNASGAPTRATDSDADSEVSSGMYLFVEEGNVNGDSGWSLVTNNPITLDTTSLVFEQFTIGDDAITEGKFIVRETPSGLVNGSNVTYTLANSVVADSETVFLNGILQEPGGSADYTISGSTITFNTAPESGDLLRINYIKE